MQLRGTKIILINIGAKKGKIKANLQKVLALAISSGVAKIERANGDKSPVA